MLQRGSPKVHSGKAVFCKVSEVFQPQGEVGEKIGQGTFGTVHAYRCARRSGSDGGRLCVKVVPLLAQRGDDRARIHEVERQDLWQLLLELRAPHIVRHHSFEQIGASLHIVLDRCEGADLSEHLEAHGTLPFAEVRTLAGQMLGAVAAVHSACIMHRDIKLENFRFHDCGAHTLKLLDFGAAKSAPQTPLAHTVTGTLLYVAPEVFDGIYCHTCDLWSVGAVLFQLASGMLPFDTPDLVVLRSLHHDRLLTGDCLFRGSAWRTAPPAARHLVRGLLTVDPCSRLSASAALRHHWLSGPESGVAEAVALEAREDGPSDCDVLGDALGSSVDRGRKLMHSKLGRKHSLLADLALIAGDAATKEA
mmetsp:Transcript_67055/g.207328  ORF Transcript_67055/g.207328 Transcript_67055/m.207328 type:complete len:363 (+) Transcript_67055:151-1239(+)